MSTCLTTSASAQRAAGTIHGVGLGPGAVDLLSVRADRLVRGARHVAYFRKAGRPGRARSMVADLLAADVREYPLEYPLTTEVPFTDAVYKNALAAFYDGSVAELATLSGAGEDVVVLCEGDPFFYGSFMHLYTRLRAQAVPVAVVPGISGMSAAWTASGTPITWGDDMLTVLMATLPEDELLRRLQGTEALVVMKVGRNLPKLKRALQASGRAQAAWVVECATMAEQRVRPLAAVDTVLPYFSIVLIHGQGRRP